MGAERAQNVLVHYSDITAHYSDITGHYSDITVHYSDITGHYGSRASPGAGGRAEELRAQGPPDCKPFASSRVALPAICLNPTLSFPRTKVLVSWRLA